MTWINTLSGAHFDYRDPQPESICIEDIATALSNECRFAGHLPQFYSVAQHSILTSRIVPPAFALEALLHDAAEAYCKDIPSPLKSLLPDYQTIEAGIESIVRNKYGLPPEMSPEVKRADLIMLATEKRDLGIDEGITWPMLVGVPLADIIIIPLTNIQAKHAFVRRWHELTAE